MKRKTSTTPTKIWSFGALRPTENEELLLEQLFQASRYYNTLIEIERKRRDDYRAVRSLAVPELGALETEYEQLKDQYEIGVKALPKAAKKKRPVLTPELVALKERLKPMSARMKELREEFRGNAAAQAEVERINREAHDAGIAAREATPLYWGTYLLIENQVDAARKSRLDPRFRSFQGEGRVGVQLQGGLTVAELRSGQDTRLQLTARPGVSEPLAPAGRRRKAFRERHLLQVRIRVGSTGRAPIWATLPVIMHRPLPADADIKWAWIKVSNTGGQRTYDLQIAMESETFHERAVGRGTCAINFGWRANDDGSKRVAYLVDDSGHEEPFVVPPSVEGTLAFADSLRSANDLHFEEAKRNVMAYLALHPEEEWLRENTKYIAQWRSPKQLARIAHALSEEHLQGHQEDLKRWRLERLSASPKKDLLASLPEVREWFGKRGIVGLVFYLELWRQKNRHLWQWEARAREKAVGRRNHLFRNWARRITNTYARIHIEEFDLREMAKTPEPDEESRHKGFRSARAVAAPGELRSRIVEVARHKVVIGDAHHNTVTCHLCHHLNERALTHRMVCAGCSQEWDQDANNCRNQLDPPHAVAAE